MGIRLIASDMDGTLLNPYAEITAANADAVKLAQEHGIEFLICSGRDYADAKTITEAAGITCGYICLSGAMVYDVDGNLLVDIPLTGDDIAVIGEVLKKHGAYMDILTDCGRYCTMPKERKLQELYYFCNGFQPVVGDVPDEVKERADERMGSMQFISQLSEIPDGVKLYKICCNDLDEETVVQMKQDFDAYPEVAAASSFPTNIELTDAKAQKGLALKAYAALKGIDFSDVMVLGDSDNDLSMFTSQFGWTVAMENSMACIRDAAKFHTKSNAEDGVAWAIHTYALSERPAKG